MQNVVQKDLDIIELLKSPWNLLFFSFTSFTVIMLFPFTKACYDFIVEKESVKPSLYQYPTSNDFKYVFAIGLLFVIIEYLCGKVLYRLFEPFCKEQENKEVRKVRSAKAIISIWKTIYFSAASFWGFRIIVSEYFMPKLLGGNGDFTQVMTQFPYSQHVPYMREYLILTMGYHVGALFNHFIHPRRNDFIEMGLHHVVTIYLMSGQYLFNVWEIGSVICVLHDVTGITTYIIKTLTETTVKLPLAIIFVLHMALWFYTRMVVLPLIIYQITTIPMDFGSPLVKPFFCYMLSCLVLLHSYWFGLFANCLTKYVKTGTTEDVHSKVKFEKKVV